MEFLAIGFLFAIAIAYFIPSIVAWQRKHNNFAAILATNILLGWTFFGWVGAFIWACTNNIQASIKK
jgi:hypothetical protein